MPRYNGEFCHLLTAIAKRDNFSVILTLLNKGPSSANKIMDSTSLPQASFRRCIKSLDECRYIFVKKSGREKIYLLNKKTVLPLLKLLGRHIKEHDIVVHKEA